MLNCLYHFSAYSFEVISMKIEFDSPCNPGSNKLGVRLPLAIMHEVT